MSTVDVAQRAREFEVPFDLRDNLALLLVLPGLFFFLSFVAIPLAYLVVLSFTDATLSTMFRDAPGLWGSWFGEAEFIGFENYVELLTDTQFWRSFGITWLFVATSVVLKVFLGVGIALVLTHEWVRGKRFMRALVILPMGLPAIFTITVWRGVFSSAQFGLANQLLLALGFDPVAWLSRRWMAFISYNITEMWLAYPFMVIITVSALQNVSTELHEAAMVDGAGFLSRFVHVTLPSIKRPVMFASILTAAASFQQFLIPFVFNRGGPARANELIILYGYREAFEFRAFGEGAAIMLTAVFFIGIFMLIAATKGRLAEGAHE
ncbi:ABC-type sugar transport system, permease component [Halalkaliarchaeum sp. AArc-CO]|uniref:carbohydrate ABC transporter permease n=1 Tax=Halalkaliarchaeum sp. AArc-CO TaxID=2866381 RepID=UPI00217DA62B|nr:sugar ABC transporter permease [Halalkaliarchaeum sp. AArc-CO]UWG49826.1 ABC-type sugar transport system, permease component [Halalkaliarchaeum sp. AArc-CO]